MIYRARRTVVLQNTLERVNGASIFLQNGVEAVADMQARVEGNEIRVEAAQTKSLYAVMIQGGVAVVRNNVAWEPTGGPAEAKFTVQFNSAAPVYAGQAYTAPVIVDGNFLDSNLVIQY